MKKLCAAAVLCFALAGSCCAGEVIATIFPVYDWLCELSEGTGLKPVLLFDSGVDLHSCQLDVFVYVGGESDERLEYALKNPVNTKRVVINLL